MNPMKIFARRSMKLNKKRTTVMVIGIILSVALISALSTMVTTAKDFVIKAAGYGGSNYQYVFYNLDGEQLEKAEKNRNVKEYFTTQYLGYAPLENGINEYKPFYYVMGMSEEDYNSSGMVISEGHFPENENEILIAKHAIYNGGARLELGDTITLSLGDRYCSDGSNMFQNNPYINEEDFDDEADYGGGEPVKEEFVEKTKKTYKVVGFMERPSSYFEDYSSAGYTAITVPTNEVTLYNIYLKFTNKGLANEEESVNEIAGEGEDALAYMPHGNMIELESTKLTDFSHSTVGVVYMMSGVVFVIIIITSVFCIRNSFNISINEKTRQYGMLASIGATKKQIKNCVLYEAGRLALYGLVPGIICGLIAARILVFICNDMIGFALGFDMEYKLSIAGILLSVVLGLLTIYLSAISGAKKASRISPMVAIRNNSLVKTKNSRLTTPGYIKKFFGVGGEIAHKNLKRNRSKYRTTVISIVVSVAVFIGLSYFVGIMKKMIVTEYGSKGYNVSAYVEAFYHGGHDEGVKALAEAEKEAGMILAREEYDKVAMVREAYLSAVSPKYTEKYMSFFPDEFDEDGNHLTYVWDEETYQSHPEYIGFDDMNIFSLGDEEYERYLKKLGLDRDEAEGKIIFINDTMYYNWNDSGSKTDNMVDIYDLKTGDKLEFLLRDPDDEDREYNRLEDYDKSFEAEICLVTDERPMGFVGVYGMPILVVSDSYFDELVGMGAEPGGSISIFFETDDPNTLAKNLNSDYSSISSVSNIAEDEKQQRSLVLVVSIFLYGFITVISLIGVTNVFNTINTGMELRRGEFATLKSIGMTGDEFNRMIRLESLMYGLKALAIGIPIGVIISLVLHKLMNNTFVTAYVPPVVPIIVSIVLVLAIIYMIMRYSVGKANNANIIETIRNENI